MPDKYDECDTSSLRLARLVRRRPRILAPGLHGSVPLAALLVFCAAVLQTASAGTVSGSSVPEPENSGWSAYDVSELEPGKIPLVTLPLTFSVAPNCRFYFNGDRIYEATIAWNPDKGLTMNGRSWEPSEPDILRGRAEYPDSILLRMYRDVPYVTRLLTEGYGIREAESAYFAQQTRIEATIESLYNAALGRGIPNREATLLALDYVATRDTLQLIDYTASGPSRGGGGVTIQYLNSFRSSGYPFVSTSHSGDSAAIKLEALRSQRPIPTEERARLTATRLYRALGGLLASPCVVFVPDWVSKCGEDHVARVFSQIDAVLAARDPVSAAWASGGAGPLDTYKLLRIVYAAQEGR